MKSQTTTQQTYQPNGESDFAADALLPCPFCGADARLIFKGNIRSKRRTVIAYCKSRRCMSEIKKATIKDSAEMVARAVIERWNNRK